MKLCNRNIAIKAYRILFIIW